MTLASTLASLFNVCSSRNDGPKKTVTVGVADPVVIKILEKEFPRRVSQVVFHKQMKALCEMAGIDELWADLKTTQRLEERKS
jgi:hypothetical protein